MKLFPALLATLALAATTAFSAEPSAFTVKVTGHGRPMILIPGLSSPGQVWDSTVNHFKDRYECHVLSLAGFAGTPPIADNSPFLASMRDAIARYIRDHHLERPVIVGHSLGGHLALELGTKNPALVGPLVVVDGVPFLTGMMRPGTTSEQARTSSAEMRRFFDAMDNATYEQSIRAGTHTRSMVVSDDHHAQIVAWSLASHRPTVTNAMTEMFSADLREDLARIQSPTLVFAAWIAYKPYTDRARTEATFREQFSRLNGVKLVISDTARHFVMLDEPQWMFEQIESFLAAHPSSSK